MLALMLRRIIPLLPVALGLALIAPAAAQTSDARILNAKIQRVTTAVATLEQVQVRLDWPATAPQGRLTVQARTVVAPDLGYRFQDLHWQCPLQHNGHGGWRCDGELRSGRGQSLRLSVDLGTASTDAHLSRGQANLALHRLAATPDDTSLDLTRVPLLWSQALVSLAWADAKLKAGTLDGQLRVRAADAHPLQVTGLLALGGAGFDTPDASIAGENLGGHFDIDYRKSPQLTTVTVDGNLQGGEFLAGNAYFALPVTSVALHVDARQTGVSGWQLPLIAWRDGDALTVDGSAAFDTDTNLQALDLKLHSSDIAPLRTRYLSGWLGLFDLGELEMRGALDADLRINDAQLQSFAMTLRDIDLVDSQGRFRFEGLNGAPRFSASGAVAGELRWRGGQLYGLDFDAASLPITSADGVLRLRDAVTVPALGGSLRFDDLELTPPKGENGLRMHFGLSVDRLEIGKIAQVMDWPAFKGELSGRIPTARYANERLDFDGGLTMQLFDGQVRVSSLSLERPFGVAPSLSADLALEDLDLEALTGVFDFGSITGRLDGRILNLRLVDWSATAFDAELHTDAAQARRRHVHQRISQRAVQNISSVGDASFVTSLQGQLIGFFDDFGYRRIAIACRLANEVCQMSGLQPWVLQTLALPSSSQAGPKPQLSVQPGSPSGFTIVQGAGVPQLTVVGFNRLVDWPTLLERLAAIGKGEVKPVVQ